MAQSDAYKHKAQVDRLADLVGADVPRDRLKVAVEEIATTDLEDRANRDLGKVDLAGVDLNAVPVEQQTPVEVGTYSGGTLPVEQQTPVEIGTWTGGTLPTEQQTPVGVQDTTGTQVDPATEGTLSTLAALVDALASNGTDTLQVDQQGVVDVASRDGRNLGDVDVTDLPDADFAATTGEALAGNGSNTYALTAVGADALDGTVVSSGQYSVTVDWEDGSGNVVTSTDVATGVAGGTETDISETSVTPYATVTISDGSGGSQTVDVGVHLR
jgi:hypothetical protein